MIMPHLADTGNAVEMAELLLAGIPNGVERAARSALSRAASYTKTAAVRRIQENFDIGAKDIRAESLVTTKYRYRPGAMIEANVRYSGRKIPLYRYGGTTPKEPAYLNYRVPVEIDGHTAWVRPGVNAKAHQFKSTQPFTLKNTFVAEMKSGHKGIFERSGEDRFPIQEKMGSSVPQMIGSRKVREAIEKDTNEKFMERFDHEVEAFVFGYRR